MNMIAKQRLLLTADKSRLVADGDPDGATLYCTPGTEIPESAAKLFGLVDGRLGEGVEVAVVTGAGDIMRVRLTLVASPIGELIVAGLIFTPDFRTIAESEIDEGQLLAILKEEKLEVEAALIGDPPPGWVPFPGRDAAILAFQERVDEDVAAGRAHRLVGDAMAEKMKLLASLPVKETPARPNKERGPGEDKEKKPDGDKGGAGGGTKGAAADDLTLVKGVGPKVAEGFAKAGITSFVQIAAIDPASPPAVEGTRATTNWAGIVASAKELVAAAPAATDTGAETASGDGGSGNSAADQKAD